MKALSLIVGKPMAVYLTDHLHLALECYQKILTQQEYLLKQSNNDQAIQSTLSLGNHSLAEVHNQAGILFFQQSKIKESRICLQTSLAIEPNQPETLNNLGIVFLSLKETGPAVKSFESSILLSPNYAEAYNNLGKALLDSGRSSEAAVNFKKAIGLNPQHLHAHNNLGVALAYRDAWEEAENSFRQALTISPDFIDARGNLAISLLNQERAEAALEHYQMIHLVRSRDADSFNNMGVCLLKLGKIEEAIRCFEKGIGFNRKHVDLVNNLGAAYAACGQMKAAMRSYKKALTLSPDYDMAHNNMGNALFHVGKWSEAQQAYLNAIKLSPAKPEFYRNLVACRQFTSSDDPCLSAMEQLLKVEMSLRKSDRIHLHFALGKVLADLRQNERSFHHFIEGNALKRKFVHYDEAASLGLMKRIQEIFTPEVMVEKQNYKHDSVVPVFIVGMPRSGSSLIEQVLASHPLIYGAGELRAIEEALVNVSHQFDPPLQVYPEMIPSISKEHCGELSQRYLKALQRSVGKTFERITDKMLSNFHYIGLIHILFPHAKIIHSRRDPVDTCLSCFSTYFAEGNGFACQLGELGRYYHGYENLMNHWRKLLPTETLIEINYEKFVTDFENQARRLIQSIGLLWDERCLNFHQAERTVRTASASQVRRPIYRSSLERWRPSAFVLQPLLDGLKGRV